LGWNLAYTVFMLCFEDVLAAGNTGVIVVEVISYVVYVLDIPFQYCIKTLRHELRHDLVASTTKAEVRARDVAVQHESEIVGS
jgi:hypothetical protein